MTPDRLDCKETKSCVPVRLKWEAPRSNEDGTHVRDIVGYRVYFGYAPRARRDYIYTSDIGMATDFTFRLPPRGQIHIAVTAYDWAGNESDFSAEAVKNLAPQVE